MIIVTAMVSPIALPSASKTPPAMPEMAAGMMIFTIDCQRLLPTA